MTIYSVVGLCRPVLYPWLWPLSALVESIAVKKTFCRLLCVFVVAKKFWARDWKVHLYVARIFCLPLRLPWWVWDHYDCCIASYCLHSLHFVGVSVGSQVSCFLPFKKETLAFSAWLCWICDHWLWFATLTATRLVGLGLIKFLREVAITDSEFLPLSILHRHTCSSLAVMRR